MLGGGSHVWIFSSIANVSSLPELGPEVSGYLDPGLVFRSMKISFSFQTWTWLSARGSGSTSSTTSQIWKSSSPFSESSEFKLFV